MLYFIVCLMGLAIVWKIFKIQVIDGPEWRAKALELSTELKKTEANRGNLIAADGSFLAISVPVYEIRMDTKVSGLTDEIFNENIDSLAFELANLFKDKSPNQYKNEITAERKKGNRYLLVKRNVTYMDLKLVKTFPIFRLGQNKGGIIAIQQYKRIKPYGYLAARTIGKEKDESQGLGLEIAYDQYLKGTEGLQMMEKLAGGLWRPIDNDNAIDPIDGYDVYTTLDPILQDVAQSELNNQLAIHGADHGCVVLMEVQTGNIKAIANLRKSKDGTYKESYNYALGESMEPGSTIKLATMLAALEEKAVSIDDTIQTGDGQYRLVKDYTMKDSRTGGHGTISVKHAFEVSSNIAMAKIVKKAFGDNPQKFVDYLKKLKLHEPLALAIPGEGTPLIKDRSSKDWSALSLPMMAIGYETKVTPLQILTLYNGIANNGKMVKPRFATEVMSRGQRIEEFQTEVIVEEMCSKQTLKELRTMLEGVVENGTAQNLKNTVYKIAGKTGTAQIAKSNAGYKTGGVEYQASFVGYFPADNPKYTCIVVVYGPTNNVYYGNLVAGPVFKAVADKVYASSFEINQVNYSNTSREMSGRAPVSFNGFTQDFRTIFSRLNINSNAANAHSDWCATQKTNTGVSIFEKVYNENLVPDFTGLGARDAIYLADKRNIRVIIKGKGVVKKQSAPVGQLVENIDIVYLDLD